MTLGLTLLVLAIYQIAKKDMLNIIESQVIIFFAVVYMGHNSEVSMDSNNILLLVSLIIAIISLFTNMTIQKNRKNCKVGDI